MKTENTTSVIDRALYWCGCCYPVYLISLLPLTCIYLFCSVASALIDAFRELGEKFSDDLDTIRNSGNPFGYVGYLKSKRVVLQSMDKRSEFAKVEDELVSLIIAGTGFEKCGFDQNDDDTCEQCGIRNEQLFFQSSGGYEPREGVYWCITCIDKMKRENRKTLIENGIKPEF